MPDQPEWSRRIRALREAKGLSQAEAAETLRQHSEHKLPEAPHLLRRWKAWELGENKPNRDYARLVASVLGTATDALFPPEHHATDLAVLSATGMDTLEIIGRLQASDVNEATLDALEITTEQLCSEYASSAPSSLILESRQWLRRIVDLQEQRLTFSQRRRTLEYAGWLTLLIGCLEYDLGDKGAADATRRMGLRLGTEIENHGILGWSHEMQAWFALTNGDFRGVLAAAEAGQASAGTHSVQVQLSAQAAKAWARMGNVDEMNRALERGRTALDHMPYPENIRNHFVVDPAKFDFYAMDCYRHVGDDRLARTLAEEVIRSGTDFNGTEHSPMRIAEARITLGVAAAREGDLDEAIFYGQRAISGPRKSIPSLLMVTRDLTAVLDARYPNEPITKEYEDQLLAIRKS